MKLVKKFVDSVSGRVRMQFIVAKLPEPEVKQYTLSCHCQIIYTIYLIYLILNCIMRLNVLIIYKGAYKMKSHFYHNVYIKIVMIISYIWVSAIQKKTVRTN